MNKDQVKGTVEKMKGILSQKHCPDAAAYERANYTQALCSFVSD